MKLDKSKNILAATLILYVVLGIIAVLIFAGFRSKSSAGNEVVYTFQDDGKAGAAVEITGVNVIGESGALEEAEPELEAEPVEAEPELEEVPVEESIVNDLDMEETERVYQKFTVATEADRLRIRKEPSLDATTLYYFQKGEEGYILFTEGDWSYIYDGKRFGYCSNEFLDITEITKEELPDFYPEEYK